MSAEDNINLWEEHLRGEFLTKNHHESLATMVDGASVYTLPTGWGATGKASLGPLYRDEFIPSIRPTGGTHYSIASPPKIALPKKPASSSIIRSGWIGSCRVCLRRGKRST